MHLREIDGSRQFLGFHLVMINKLCLWILKPEGVGKITSLMTLKEYVHKGYPKFQKKGIGETNILQQI